MAIVILGTALFAMVGESGISLFGQHVFTHGRGDTVLYASLVSTGSFYASGRQLTLDSLGCYPAIVAGYFTCNIPPKLNR
jgi:hypothetical protein